MTADLALRALAQADHRFVIDPDGIHVTIAFAVLIDDAGASIGSIAVAREFVREG